MKEKFHTSNYRICIAIFLCISVVLILLHVGGGFYSDSSWFFSKNRGKSDITHAIFTQFLHGDFFHLLFNIVALIFFVYRICEHVRWNHIVLVYAISLIVTGVMLILFAKDNKGYLGNSGAVFAIFGFWLTIPNGKIDEKNEKFSEFIAMIGSTIFFVNISWIMHISGLLVGIIYGVLMGKLKYRYSFKEGEEFGENKNC